MQEGCCLELAPKRLPRKAHVRFRWRRRELPKGPSGFLSSLQYAEDPEPIVADSCIVALDMLHFEQSGGFQYADGGEAAAAEQAGAAAVVASA